MDELLKVFKNESAKKIKSIKDLYESLILKYRDQIAEKEKAIKENNESISDCQTEISRCQAQMDKVNSDINDYLRMIPIINQYSLVENKEKEVREVEDRRIQINRGSETKIAELNATINDLNGKINGYTAEIEQLKEIINNLEMNLSEVVNGLESDLEAHSKGVIEVTQAFNDKVDQVIKTVSKLMDQDTSKKDSIKPAETQPIAEVEESRTDSHQMVDLGQILSKPSEVYVPDTSESYTTTKTGQILGSNSAKESSETTMIDISKELSKGLGNVQPAVDSNDSLASIFYNSPTDEIGFQPFAGLVDRKMEISPFAGVDQLISDDVVEQKPSSINLYLGLDTAGFDDQEKDFIMSSMTPEKYNQISTTLHNYGIDLRDISEIDSFVEKLVTADPEALNQVLNLLRSVGKNNEELDFLFNLNLILGSDPKIVKGNIDKVINDKKDPKNINISHLCAGKEFEMVIQLLQKDGYDFNGLIKAYPITITQFSGDEFLNNVSRTDAARMGQGIEMGRN